MPQSICRSCSKQLKCSYDFVQQVQECNDKLIKMIPKQYLDCLLEQTIDMPQPPETLLIVTDAKIETGDCSNVEENNVGPHFIKVEDMELSLSAAHSEDETEFRAISAAEEEEEKDK